MCADLIPVWFWCKSCQASFQKLENFIEHKKNKHFNVFQKRQCIVFEETTHLKRPQDFLYKQSHLSQGKCDPNQSNESKDPSIADSPFPASASGFGGTDSDSDDVDDTFLYPNVVYDNSDSDADAPIKVDPDADPGRAPTKNADDELLTPQNSPSSRSNRDNDEPTSNPADLTKRRTRRRKVKVSTNTDNKDSSDSSFVERPFICKTCGRGFKTRKTLLSHHVTHSDLRPHRCSRPDCDAAFKSKMSLYAHEKNFHSNVKPYNCPQSGCSKSFKTKKCVNRHFERAHTVRERVQCPECGKLFAANQNLKSHLKFQHGHNGGKELEKRCVCEICGKQFAWNALLQDHKLSHSEERPFNCTVEGCFKAFKRLKDVTTHVQKRHATTNTNADSGGVPVGE